MDDPAGINRFVGSWGWKVLDVMRQGWRFKGKKTWDLHRYIKENNTPQQDWSNIFNVKLKLNLSYMPDVYQLAPEEWCLEDNPFLLGPNYSTTVLVGHYFWEIL